MKTKSILKFITALILVVIVVLSFIKISLPEALSLFLIAAMVLTYMYSRKKSLLRYIIQLSSIFMICYSSVIIFLRGYCSLHHAVLIGFPMIALFTWVLAYMYRKYLVDKTIFLTLLFSLLLLEGPIRVIRPDSTFGSLPTFIFAIFGIIIGYALFRKQSLKNWSLAIVVFGGSLWMYCDGYNMWLNKRNYGTYTKKMLTKASPDYTFQNEEGDTIRLSQMRGKTVLLDFWSTRCGACWRKFPEVQNLYESYRLNKKVIITAVFVEYENREWERNISRLRDKYSFPTLKITKDNPLITDLPIRVYPTVIVIDAEGNMIYWGSIEGACELLDKHID